MLQLKVAISILLVLSYTHIQLIADPASMAQCTHYKQNIDNNILITEDMYIHNNQSDDRQICIDESTLPVHCTCRVVPTTLYHVQLTNIHNAMTAHVLQ